MRKCFITVCVINILLLLGVLNVCAMSTYELETTFLSENEINQIWQNTNIRKLSDPVSLNDIGLPIVSFDVSEDGMLLLGFEENKIAVADEKNVLNFFEFSGEGSFYVQWHDDNIMLLSVRGSVIIEFSQDGQLINIIQTDNSSEKNNSFWNQIAKRNHIDIGQSSYCIKNNMGIFNFFASSYSQLVAVDAQGNQTILYDISNTMMIKTIVIFIAVIMIIAIVLSSIGFQFFKQRHPAKRL